MPTFAAIDIGANSVRLKIARLRRKRLVVLAEDREVTRLGESVFRSGLLDPQAMAHTVKVLRRFHRLVQEHAATTVRVVATSSLRDANNAPAFIDWVQSATGWRIEVISGLEEGRLIHLGIISNTRVAAHRLLLFDLGGGSCELTVSSERQIKDIVSLPLGAVRLTKDFLLHDPPKKRELERMRAFISEELGRVERRMSRAGIEMAIATSGTAAALAGLWSAQNGAANSTTVPRAAVVALVRKLSKASLQQRIAMKGIGPRRAEIIVAGAAVFAEILTRLNLASFRYLALGLRDGILAQMMAEQDAGTRVRKQVDKERENTLAIVGHRYGVDKRYAERARANASLLFKALRSIHRLPPEYEQWLAAAAMLHEIGSFVNRAGRHRHTHYLIAHSELFGFTPEQRAVVAAIARYVGNSRPRLEHRVLRVLPELDRHYVIRAVALLRIALALDKSRAGNVRNLRIRLTPSDVNVSLSAKPGTGDLEVWALEKERNYFRAVFGRDLRPSLLD